MGNVVEVKNLTKRIRQKTIVDNVSFCLEEGVITGLLGPNGAGKTTIIRLLVSLMEKTSGEITIAHHPLPKEFSQGMKKVGAIIETPEFYNYLTGEENLRILGKMANKKVSETEIQKALQEVHLTEQKDQKVRTYSLGMRQRLGVAQAMVHHPQVLIFDEPMNGLDPAGIKEFRELVFSLKKQGVSILISSHQLSEIEQMCDKLLVLQKGKITHEENLTKTSQELLKIGSLHLETDDLAKTVKLLENLGYAIEEKSNYLLVHLNTDSRQEIVKVLVEQNISLYSFYLEKPTLEESFLTWTKGGELK